jgi:hypothetical protein
MASKRGSLFVPLWGQEDHQPLMSSRALEGGENGKAPKARNSGCIGDVPDGMRLAQLGSVLRNRLPQLGGRGTAGNGCRSAEELGRTGTGGRCCRSGVRAIDRDESGCAGAEKGEGRIRATFQAPEGCFCAGGQASHANRCRANRVDERPIAGLASRSSRDFVYAEAAAASSSA